MAISPVEQADFYTVEEKNNRRTALLIVLYLLLFCLCGLVLDTIYGFFPGIPVISVSVLAFAGVQTLISLNWGGELLARALGGRPLAHFREFRYRRALNVVREVSIAAGVPMPRVYVIPEPFPNAMVAGTRKDRACLCLTTGLILLMDRDELQGVVAHEFGHVLAGDMRLMTMMSALLGAIAILSEYLIRGVWVSGRRRVRLNRGIPIPLIAVGLLIGIASPFIGRIIAYSVSRFREYAADAAGARIIRNPGALAQALEKIGRYQGDLEGGYRAAAHMFFVDFYRGDANPTESAFANLTNTHPPLKRRIAILKKMAGEPVGDITRQRVEKAPVCPSCGARLKPLKAKTAYGLPLMLDQCERCGGIWFDKYELSAVGPGFHLEKLINVENFKKPSPYHKGPLVCPRCGVKLKAVRDPGLPKSIVLEHCPLCAGTWLNLEEVKTYIKWRRKKKVTHEALPEELFWTRAQWRKTPEKRFRRVPAKHEEENDIAGMIFRMLR